jgi:ribosomal protein L34E
MSTGPTTRTRTVIKHRAERLGWPLCERCGREPVEQIHHRRPRAAGGSKRADTNVPSNLLGLGVRCHQHVERHRAEAYANGWLLRSWQTPLETPVRIHDRGLVLLDDIGGMTPALLLGDIAC